MELVTLLLAFLISFVTMFFGALSGGIGLVTRPALIFLGYSPQIAVGTSRVSSILGDLPSIFLLNKYQKPERDKVIWLVISIWIGTICGSFFVLSASDDLLRLLIGIISLCMVILLIIRSRFGLVETQPKFTQSIRAVIAFFGTKIISFLGAFSGGLGQYLSFLYIWLYGKTYIGAAALWRIAGYIGGLAGSIIFIWKGVVDWQLWVALSLGFMLGSYFGTRYGLKKGNQWVRIAVIVVAGASAIKLIFF